MKKRFFPALLLCIALAFTLSGTALAVGTAEYESSELGLSFSAPEDFKILSRDSYKTDPVAEELPYAMETLDSWFTGDGDCYFLGGLDPMRCVFTLRAYPNGRDYFVSAIEDGELDSLTEDLADGFTEDGCEVLSAPCRGHRNSRHPQPENAQG